MPDQNVLIRPARLDDLDAVWPLTSAFATSFSPERGTFESLWTYLIAASSALLVVAETQEGEVVGYLLAHLHVTLFANGSVGWVEEVMVSTEHRGAGIGRRLMEHAEKWCTAAGARYLALATRRAADFYTALDYEESDVFFKKNLA